MTERKSRSRSRNSRLNQEDMLKDEVYRQMYRLEAHKPGADLDLAIALLRGWLEQNPQTESAQLHEWLKQVCPICLLMIEAARRGGNPEERCIP